MMHKFFNRRNKSMTIRIRRNVSAAVATLALASNPLLSAAEEPVWTKGEITAINVELGKVTVRHEEIKNLDMPPMRMIFGVTDPEIIANLKIGNKKEFYFVDQNGRMMIKQVK